MSMLDYLHNDWKGILENEFEKQYFKDLTSFLEIEFEQKKIYPSRNLIFKALQECSFKKTKVVIIGQDPYHGFGQANGLCFSVNDGISLPPSLRNIFKEIKSDLNIEIPLTGNLIEWSKQGVLLLNSVLTVEAKKPTSHAKKGWEIFTNYIIEYLSNNKKNIVYLLWGSYAQKKGVIINSSNHLILSSVHPSPLSAHKGFFGNKHFSKTNMYLISNGNTPINW